MSRFRIAPSILSADFARLGEQAQAAADAGADWIHVDVMDGHFVPSLSMGPEVVRALAPLTDLPLDVHLMVEDPDLHLEAFARAGASRIGVHVEACRAPLATLGRIRELGVRACVALNPATPAEAIRPLLAEVDQVLVMTVNPGRSGQKLIRSALLKLRQIRGWIEAERRNIDLVVDGGIGLDSVEDAVLHGADVGVMGSAFFGSRDYKVFVDQVRAILDPYTHSCTTD